MAVHFGNILVAEKDKQSVTPVDDRPVTEKVVQVRSGNSATGHSDIGVFTSCCTSNHFRLLVVK